MCKERVAGKSILSDPMAMLMLNAAWTPPFC
jgi:hypothetical protein